MGNTLAQTLSVIPSILSAPFIYDSLQGVSGVRRSGTVLANDLLKVEPGQKTLGIGCGAGTPPDCLPGSKEYVDIDSSEEYIEFAKTSLDNGEH